MQSERDFWIETVDKTFLYYKVNARSREEALDKFTKGEGEYVGCNDKCDERVRDVVEERPHITWT